MMIPIKRKQHFLIFDYFIISSTEYKAIERVFSLGFLDEFWDHVERNNPNREIKEEFVRNVESKIIRNS